MVKVAINGFGRIGRGFMRAALEKKEFNVEAINDLTSPHTLGHLMRYDTVMGKFPGTVEISDDALTINGDEMKVLSERDPAKLPWKEMGIDIVIESTGFFRKREDAEKHISAGAKKVLISAPGSGEMFTVVLGVNEADYNPAEHHVISNASCTTNCLGPMVKVLDQSFGIETGLVTTIHAVTNDQRMLDMWHKDLRRARAGAWNMIPTTTGAAKAIGLVYPKMIGKLNGMAIRVPLMDVSLIDMVATVGKEVSKEEVNEAFKKAAESGDLAPYLGYVDEPLVSSDFINNPDSCSFDSIATMTQGNLVKALGWYDNEAGYSARLADLASIVAKKL